MWTGLGGDAGTQNKLQENPEVPKQKELGLAQMALKGTLAGTCPAWAPAHWQPGSPLALAALLPLFLPCSSAAMNIIAGKLLRKTVEE